MINIMVQLPTLQRYVRYFYYSIPYYQAVEVYGITGDMWITTKDGLRQVQDLTQAPFTALVDGKLFKIPKFQLMGHAQIIQVETHKGYYFNGTNNLRVMTYSNQEIKGYIQAQNLTVREIDPTQTRKQGQKRKVQKQGTLVALSNNRGTTIDRSSVEDFEKGKLIGWVVGDGSYNYENNRGQLDFFLKDLGQQCETIANWAYTTLNKYYPTDYVQKRKPYGPRWYKKDQHFRINSIKINKLCKGIIQSKSKIIHDKSLQLSDSFLLGLCQGYFSADGSASKRGDVRLVSVSLENLQKMQLILSYFGINSNLSLRDQATRKKLIRRHGQNEYNNTQAAYCVIISSKSAREFQKKIKFGHDRKDQILEEYVRTIVPRNNKNHDTAEVSKLGYVTEEQPVYAIPGNQQHCLSVRGVLIDCNSKT